MFASLSGVAKHVGCVKRTSGVCRCVPRTRQFWLLLIGLGLLVGCGRGSELPRAAVSGKVSYQGKPVPEGMITFVPIKGAKGPTANALIREGVYEVIAAGGVPVGTHRVEVQAFRPLNKRSNRPGFLEDMEPREQYLPSQYNRQSTLEITVEDKGKQTRDFDLE